MNVVLAEGFMHGVGALVFKDVDSGGYIVLCEVFVARCPGCNDLRGL